MDALIPIFFGFLFIGISVYNYKIYRSYKQGFTKDNILVTKVIWKPKNFHVKFDFLFDQEIAVITYTFSLGNSTYEKTEETHMQYIKGAINKGSRIQIFIPKSKNPNQATMINPIANKMKYILGIALMGMFLVLIGYASL